MAGAAALVHADQVGTEWQEQPAFADADELVGTAQTAWGSGPMTVIRGQISTTDSDVFVVYIPDLSLFSATTSGTGTTTDTQLFLLTSTGMGIACNDDTASGNPRSTLPLGSALYTGYGPGTYLLAIARYDRDPVSAGGLIFPTTPVTDVFGPTAPGGTNPMIGWAGTVSGSPLASYTIALTGAEFVSLAPPDVAPTAVAGPDQSIHARGTVLLDGSASFDDNTASAALNYFWSFVSAPSGSTAVLSSLNTAQTTFEADLAGSYIVQLIVQDSAGQFSDPSIVTIASTNLAPTADAGSTQTVIVGDIVALDGSGSTDPENDALTYQWTLSAAPSGSAAALVGGSTAAPQFTPDLAGSYTIDLIVDDGLGPSLPASVTIVAITGAEFAENTLMSVQATVAALPASSVSNRGNQIALSIFLRQAIRSIQCGHPLLAREFVEAAIYRTDGMPCAAAPTPTACGATGSPTALTRRRSTATWSRRTTHSRPERLARGRAIGPGRVEKAIGGADVLARPRAGLGRARAVPSRGPHCPRRPQGVDVLTHIVHAEDPRPGRQMGDAEADRRVHPLSRRDGRCRGPRPWP